MLITSAIDMQTCHRLQIATHSAAAAAAAAADQVNDQLLLALLERN